MLNIKISGIVQGVGFRPFVKNLADKFNLRGSVANRGSYVEIDSLGSEVDLKNFLDALQTENPPRSTILSVDVREVPDKNFSDFQIVNSTRAAGNVFVSPDIAICDKCAAELFDPTNRRYLHPFINCTACGARLTILKNMPYDRERTTMSEFPMCDACAEEYFDPNSRRYDAQPICCNDCGCEVYVLGSNLRGHDAIKHARKILAEGGLVAIKGIGGFHLACDATNFTAVQRLRDSKTRPTKPFAVMFRDLDALKRECIVTAAQIPYLDSPQKPIVLLQKKIGGSIAPNVAPHINRLGVMLPYTPLHLLIFNFPDELKNFPDALVMTSGNPAGVPITVGDEDAAKNFGFCDAILSHNRKILLRADDSVMDFIDDRPSMIRRSRGYAPLPIFYDGERAALAVGGELKNTFCLAKNGLLYASPYIGDVGDWRTLDVLENSIRRMSDLLEITPEVIACDLHPRYQTTALAKKIADTLDVPLIKVQHHYAHILSCMAENNQRDAVIGVAFDGTGYGDDGTIWGGEFFICDTHHYERAATITPFKQAGGDKSAREGRRIALALVDDLDVARELKLADDKNLRGVKFLLDNNVNCATSTSVGRLFDAVAAVLGICTVSTYEGEAAMRLQACAERSDKKFRAGFTSTAELFTEILTRRLDGQDVCDLARLFHAGLAEFTAQVCEDLSLRAGLKTVALSGGVFQNSLLSSLTAEGLRRRGMTVLRHELIPANDGGLCIGQAVRAIQD